MKAISLWQPWASALFTGLKPDETRSWQLPLWAVDTIIAIHAAKRDTTAERWIWDEIADTSDLEAFRNVGVNNYAGLPRGCIIGTVVFEPSIRLDSMIRRCRTPAQMEWGDYSDGRFAWPVKKAVLFPEPIPYIGRQGFFDWSPPDLRTRELPAP